MKLHWIFRRIFTRSTTPTPSPVVPIDLDFDFALFEFASRCARCDIRENHTVKRCGLDKCEASCQKLTHYASLRWKGGFTSPAGELCRDALLLVLWSTWMPPAQSEVMANRCGRLLSRSAAISVELSASGMLKPMF
jgi:hypothetical protein